MIKVSGAALSLEWAVSGEAARGEMVSGDHYVVAGSDEGVLLAAIDGLGHGPEAAVAAREAASVLERHAAEPLLPLMRRCHDALKGTRGAVVSMASIDVLSATMIWLGVGNVEAVLFRADAGVARARESISLRGGVVGYELPPLKPTTLTVVPGDVLVFATDGIRSGFANAPPEGPVQAIADSLLDEFGRGHDDALVLVARFLGGSA